MLPRLARPTRPAWTPSGVGRLATRVDRLRLQLAAGVAWRSSSVAADSLCVSAGCACRLRLAVTLLVKNLSHMHVSSSTSKGGMTSIGVAPPQTLDFRGAETVAAEGRLHGCAL